ncbi:DNA-binding protein [Sporosarcina sp. FSL K6-2383]|uniref:DNA-binding protein n=1 Tax=Sporosarcina sp. FSL K6-2383 TaxID=2921556 RepID=UPI00315AA8CE
MLTVEFDYEKLAEAMRPVVREEIQEMMKSKSESQEWPPLLTVTQLKELFHIKSWKASELMGRPDFPVIREAGVLIHRDKLFEWIDRHTKWVDDNTSYFKVG